MAVWLLISSTALTAAAAQDTALVGLWHAKRCFGPDVRGDRGNFTTLRELIPQILPAIVR